MFNNLEPLCLTIKAEAGEHGWKTFVGHVPVSDNRLSSPALTFLSPEKVYLPFDGRKVIVPPSRDLFTAQWENSSQASATAPPQLQVPIRKPKLPPTMSSNL